MNSPLLATTISELRKVKRLAEQAIEQLDDPQLSVRLDPESNSVAVLMRHVAGNMRSRWTDFRTSDGEKPDRQRDQEFEDRTLGRSELMAEWEDGWRRLFEALEALTDADLSETVFIRREPHTIHKAIVRQIVHYSGHAYQILFIAKHLKGPEWSTLSVPRGKSEEFNRKMFGAEPSTR